MNVFCCQETTLNTLSVRMAVLSFFSFQDGKEKKERTKERKENILCAKAVMTEILCASMKIASKEKSRARRTGDARAMDGTRSVHLYTRGCGGVPPQRVFLFFLVLFSFFFSSQKKEKKKNCQPKCLHSAPSTPWHACVMDDTH